MKNKFISLIFIGVCVFLLCTSASAASLEDLRFSGSGTLRDPYQISSKEDLLRFASAVNSGNHFEGQYFVQTKNIDLENTIWVPIGEFGTDNSFCGIYDGNGFFLENLISPSGGNGALFGQLGGTVMNLGIESGSVSGACLGSITSHSSRSSAIIINCYNKAAVYGHRAGGIADNFNGSIVNCWTDCELIATDDGQVGGIVSYGVTFSKNCYSLRAYDEYAEISPDGCLTLPDISNEQLASILNKNLHSSASSIGIDASKLNIWIVDEHGNLVLSQEKYALQMKDIPVYIYSNMVYIIPLCIACFALILLFFGTLDKRPQIKCK